jgi:hypothetical protein
MITDCIDYPRDRALRTAWAYLLRRDLPEHLPSYATTLTLPGLQPFARIRKDIGCYLSRLQHHLKTRIGAVGIIVRRHESMHIHMILIAADYTERLKVIALPDIDNIVRSQWRRYQDRSDLEVQTDKIFDLNGYCTYLTRPRNLDLAGDRSYIFWHNRPLLEKLRDIRPRKKATA